MPVLIGQAHRVLRFGIAFFRVAPEFLNLPLLGVAGAGQASNQRKAGRPNRKSEVRNPKQIRLTEDLENWKTSKGKFPRSLRSILSIAAQKRRLVVLRLNSRFVIMQRMLSDQ
jgi:hypothetical protein